MGKKHHPGDRVPIISGPFAGYDAIFERHMEGNERVALVLKIRGRKTRLIMSGDLIDGQVPIFL